MFKLHKSVYYLLFVGILLSSCVSRKKLTYLQYSSAAEIMTPQVGEGKNLVTPTEYKVMPYDNLFIRVVTPDPQWAELFNTSEGGAITAESASLFGYQVDINGNIEIPFVGDLDVGGKTLSEIKVKLDSTFKHYLKDASITVKLINNYVSIIGEVNQPGRYPISKDQINIFEALAMAGDLTEFSNRKKIQLVRPSNYGPIVKEFSLLEESV